MTENNFSFLSLTAFLLFFLNVQAQFVVKNDDSLNKFSLHEFVSIIDVQDQNLTINQVVDSFGSYKPTPLRSENDDLGFSQNHFWAKTGLVNATNKELLYYLETARPMTDVVELFIIDRLTGKITKKISGDALPYETRDFPSRKSIFELILPPKAQFDLYLHLKSDGEVLKIPMLIYSTDSYISMISKENLFFGILYGMLLIVAIIYFFFFFALKEKIFLFYSLYVIFVGLLQFSLDGFFYKFIVSDGGWFSRHAIILIAIVAVFMTGIYSQFYLRIKENSKSIYILFMFAYVLLVFLLLSVVFLPSILLFSYIFVNVLTLIFLSLIVFSIGFLYFTKKPVDPYFTIGILFLILGFGVFILYNFGLLPITFFTQNSSKLGTALEMVFLSLSMSNLIRNLKNEKNELTRLALVRSEEMNDLKSYFLSNISHELRTPLNAIMNLIDSISNEVHDDKIRKNCQIIKYSSHSLLSSVNDILDFSKIEKGELKLERNQFDPVQVFENLKNNAINRAEDKGLVFQFSKSGTFPDLVIGDVNRLVQVVNNVLNNAIKFTTKGFVKFHVDCQLKEGNKVKLILTVSDSGVGIPKDKIESIFDSFSQNNIDNKRKFGGLGLGLYIVKTLVDMQNGTIQMNSKINEGTTCVVTIDFAVSTEKRKLEASPKTVIDDLAGKSILVVEDNPINQMVIKMIAKKWLNTKVVYTNNGQEALDAFKTNQFDIVLMDLQMPIMDGYEATVAIRNGEAGPHNSNIPIIAVTADVMETTKDRVKEIGMNDYLSKPIKKETLYEAVKKLV
ncbi:hybrid sensor histidine kinase/response regulator [Flavobacterium glaciei]|uniref:histidine kinase n=1 Tax=Flavobacterium glaciei TaxID=386300 RepID=A0A562PJS8_9FLAO|nr:hybrid sensor histidine kinase/response regulator [Flavobacterium glaciei]RDI50440.1 signal transduction histidine kinase [Flavobacterium glaciei]TWI44694.1 signal transduction histidine kinase [Flavobacterium glaciei]